jgi:hypothetical protein
MEEALAKWDAVGCVSKPARPKVKYNPIEELHSVSSTFRISNPIVYEVRS